MLMIQTLMTHLLSRRLLAVGMLLTGLTVRAQPGSDALAPVKLSSDKLPAGWRWVGSVSATPDDRTLTARAGTTGLLGGSEPLTLLQTTDDFRLRLELLLPTGAGVQLTLPNGRNLTIDATSDVRAALKAPGLWQTLDLWYRAATKGQPASVEKMVLNGVTVAEDQRLPDRTSPTGTVAVRASGGAVALRNPSYQLRSNRAVVGLTNVRYRLVEGEAATAAEVLSRPALLEGPLPAITHEVAYGQTKRYALVYTADLEVPEAGPLTFTVQHGGVAGLQIDGKDVIAPTYADLGQPQTAAPVSLSAGKHQLTVFFSRSWPRPGLGVFVAGAGTRPQPLHPLASLPEPDPVGQIAVRAADRPALLRSFIQLPGEKTKRTHCLSVGTPAGYHYTVDLNQGAWLQAWKGDFADVTEMWHERGEPQLLKPLGAVVRLGGPPTLAALTDARQPWPDSLDAENDMLYKGWKLGPEGLPTLQYAYRGATISDVIVPTAGGLSRTLTVSGGTGLYARLVAGTDLVEVSRGLYAVDDRSYYVRIDSRARPLVRNNRELLLPLSNGSVQYTIIW